MNGHEHYAEAERLLEVVAEYPFEADRWSTFTTATAAAAQVHATLALAAATTDTANQNRKIADAIDKANHQAPRRPSPRSLQ